MLDPSKSCCTGCGACYSICPKQCILMEQDNEGFLYPVIDEANCTKCEKCGIICPAIVQGMARRVLNVYAAKNHDEEIRHQSSSGGIFSLLAGAVIQEGGVVFGARFNDAWEVIHDYTETIEGLATFRGSKYVQSVTRDTYKQTREFLENNRKVLYSGTPCQIAGLKAFLQKNYDNFLTIDFVCHGVPSPLVWKKYLSEVIESMNMQHISNINFRDKSHGWKDFHFVVTSDESKAECKFIETLSRNSFMKGFLRNLYLRPSCHDCPVKLLKSGSDITIADYWGIQNVLPEFDDDKGVSLVMINTSKGKNIYSFLDKDDHETNYAEALIGNSHIEESSLPHKKRVMFFDKLHTEPVILLIDRFTVDSVWVWLRRLMILLLHRLGLLVFIELFFKKIKGYKKT